MELITLEEFRNSREDLAEYFNSLSREELIEQCFKEGLDAVNMETRYSFVMNRLDSSYSKTNYDLDVINTACNEIESHIEYNFASDILDEAETDKEIANLIREKVREYEKN